MYKSIKTKILIIPIIAITLFLLYCGTVTFIQSKILDRIATTSYYFPLIQRLSETAFLFERLVETNINIAMTSDERLLSKSKLLSKNINNNFQAIIKNYCYDNTCKLYNTLMESNGSFKKYMLVSENITHKIVNNSALIDDIDSEINQMNNAQEKFSKILNILRSELYQNLQKSLDLVRSSHNQLLIFGIINTLTALIVITFISRAIANRVSRNVNDVIVSLNNIAEGTGGLVKRLKFLSDSEKHTDEIGTLVKITLDMENKLNTQKARILQEKANATVANKAKSEFLANMSHELRTPLNSMLVLTDELIDNENKNLSEEQLLDLSIIKNSGQTLLSLINEILDISKIEAGKLQINIEKVNLLDIVSEIENTFQPIAKTKEIHLQIDLNITKAQELDFYTDKMRLIQILNNLLTNAFKFTCKGTVNLKIYTENYLNIAFEVIDSGIGIKKNKLHSIFNKFEQADSTTSRDYGGTGLGLPISQYLASLLGGKISVSSIYGSGSTFKLIISRILKQQDDKSSEISKIPINNSDCENKSLDNNYAQENISGVILVLERDPKSLVNLYKIAKNINFSLNVIVNIDDLNKVLTNNKSIKLVLINYKSISSINNDFVDTINTILVGNNISIMIFNHHKELEFIDSNKLILLQSNRIKELEQTIRSVLLT